MRKSTLLFLIIFTVALGALIYWVYPIIRERYFLNDNPDSSQSSQEEVAPANQPADSTDPSSPSNNPAEEIEEISPTVTPQKAFETITTADCNNECTRFDSTSKNFEYCQEVCGLATKIETPSNDCQNLSNLKKDYCLKDEAVAKKDFKLCDSIADTGIRQTCQNRITEDLLNQEPQP